MLMQATDLTIRYGTRAILDHASLFIDEKEKIGVVGANGQGKSTLLRIIATQDEAYGKFTKKPNMTISYLAQQPQFPTTMKLADYLRQHENEEQFYRFRSLLTKFKVYELDKCFSQMSGGQQKRVALALALSKEADLLILDEPTNHLDMEMIVWLEKYLARYRGAVLMVTHDRYFLERITNTIIEVSLGQLYLSHGGYQGYLDYASQRLADAFAKKRKRDTLLRQETLWVKAGVEARRTKSRDRLARYESLLKEKDPVVLGQVEMNTTMQRLGKKTITISQLSKQYDDRILFENFTYQIQPYDRIGILGENGVGKTSLLNIICGKDKDYFGSVEIGQTIQIGYFDQLSMHLDESKIAYDYIREISDVILTSEGAMSAKAMMNQFLFDDDTMYLPINRLSGGQKRRLYLLSVLMKQPNVLIFDEPTNDLDIDTLTVLEDFLDHFDGIVITVSHDRYFLDKVVDKMFVFENQKIQIYNGTCSDYLESYGYKENTKKEKKENVRVKEKTPRLTYQQQKERDQLEVELESLEKQLKEITHAFENPDLDYEKVDALSKLQAQLEAESESKTERYLTLLEIEEASHQH